MECHVNWTLLTVANFVSETLDGSRCEESVQNARNAGGAQNLSLEVPHNAQANEEVCKHEKLSKTLTQVAKFLQLLQRHSEAEIVYKLALHHQSTTTEYSAQEHSQLRYIECVMAIGVACARQNDPIKLEEASDWLSKALETVQLLLMVCMGEALSSTLQSYQGGKSVAQ